MILFLVKSLLMFIPRLGISGTALSNSLRGVLRIAGKIRDTARDLFSIVVDPFSALVAVFEGVLKSKDFAKAAKMRREMSAKEINVSGPPVAAKIRRTAQIRRTTFGGSSMCPLIVYNIYTIPIDFCFLVPLNMWITTILMSAACFGDYGSQSL